MQDVNPQNNDRSIRNIPIPPNHRRAPQDMPEAPRRMQPPRRRRSLWRWALLIVAVCVVAGLLLSTLFSGASITIYPKTQTITPPATVTAQPNAPAGMLAYQTMTIARSATTTVTASGSEHVSKSATGIITVYNAYDTANQELITQTRFEAPDGKIYRIHNPIVVPGATKTADGTLKPGSVTVTVYADAPGAGYNRADPTQFSIPGFKNTARYGKFYAQSQGPIAGGFVGDQPAVSPADMATAQQTLKTELDAGLRSAAVANTPAGFFPVTGSLGVTYSDIAQSSGGQGDAVTLSQTANATMAIVRSADLASLLAGQVVSGYGGEPVDFASTSPITLALVTSSSGATTGPLVLSLSGTPTLVWQFDPQAVKDALLGKKKSAFQDIIKTFTPAITMAQASIRPFWKTTFPTDPHKLTIEVKTQ